MKKKKKKTIKNNKNLTIPENIRKSKISLWAIVYRGSIIDIKRNPYTRKLQIGEILIPGTWKPDSKFIKNYKNK